ncbi:unnamed protein product, partial [Meganyctiphanes norvegica]
SLQQWLCLYCHQLPDKSGHSSGWVFDKAVPLCKYPFEEVESSCYYFSDTQLSFENALAYCEDLTNGNPQEISLAMLGFGREEDQAILDAVTSKDNVFWIGGGKVEGQWKWLDGRKINNQVPFWFGNEPNDDNNKCIVAQEDVFDQLNRFYLFDNTCEDSLNFICQTGNINCPNKFHRIGNHCYFLSWDLHVTLPWQDARYYCQTLAVYDGFHADLAVLELPDQDDYYLMNTLIDVAGYNSSLDSFSWLGAFAGIECNYHWVDGRTLPSSSILWLHYDPNCQIGEQEFHGAFLFQQLRQQDISCR